MVVRWVVIAACSFGVVACKKDEPAAAVEQTPESKRKAECERFATDMARTGLLAGQVLVTALSDDPARASEGREGMKSEARALRQRLLDQCMQWPEDVIACLPPLGILEDGCEEKLLAAMDGGTPPPKDVPPGPAPAWSTTLAGELRHAAVERDGTVLAVVGDGLVGLRDGKVAWRKQGAFEAWLVRLPGEPSTWAAGVDDRVIALDPADGEERWVATLPVLEAEAEAGDEALPEDDDDLERDMIEARADTRADVKIATLMGEGLLVGDAEARFFRVDPERCAAGAKARAAAGCVTPAGRLPDEILEDDARLFVDANGKRYLWETGVLRAFADGWRTLMTARAHDSLQHVTVADGRLVLLVDHEVVELDPTQCRGEAAFAPSEWPQPGVLFVRDADQCSDCGSPPPGCRRWRTFLDDVTGEAPALLAGGAVVVHADGYTLALRDGQPQWKVSTGGGGPLASDGARIFGFSTSLREGDPPGAFELATDGTLRWRSPLPLEVGELYFSDEIHLALAGGWLVVAYEQTVTALALPPA